MSKTRVALVGLFVVLILASSAFAIYTYTRRVSGISMLPTLEEGDLVVVQPVPINQVSVGDIVVYTSPCSEFGEAIIHRAVNVAGNGFITKGDNNGLTDQGAGLANAPITQSCLEGKVVFVIPYLERLSELPYGVNYVIASLIVVFVLYTEIRSWRSADEGGKEATPGEASGAAQP